jgi:hypothetical protein
MAEQHDSADTGAMRVCGAHLKNVDGDIPRDALVAFFFVRAA